MSFGVWAYKLTPSQYQDLIDRGWRRSGQYLYKPQLDKTCCPQYTIRLDTSKYELRKSNKKVFKKMRRFVHDGVGKARGTDKEENASDDDMEDVTIAEKMPDMDTLFPNIKLKSNVTEGMDLCQDKPSMSTTTEAKLPTSMSKSKPSNKTKSKQKDIVDWIEEAEGMNGSETLKHRLRLELVPAAFDKDTYDLYCKYQHIIHKDDYSDLSEAKFTRFLVNNPVSLLF